MSETKPCYFCKKQTTVARVSPASEEIRKTLTGCYLFSKMDQDFNNHVIGVVCKDCMFDDKNKLMLGFCGGKLGAMDNWEASF